MRIYTRAVNGVVGNMKSEDRTLGDILEISKQYHIPVFQRYYQWNVKHWKELWKDLDEYLPLRIAERTSAKHFMGPIVGFEGDSPEQWVVIDGQQRLTTVVVLLIAIRDVAKELEANISVLPGTDSPTKSLSDRINDRFLTTRRGDLKLKPREDSDPLKSDYLTFEGLMQEDAQGSEKSLLRAAYNFFSKRLKKPLSGLERLVDLMAANLTFCEITLGEDDDPYQVFQRLNKAGEKITEADCLRNYFYMRVETSRHEDLKRWWAPIETVLRGADGKDRITDFCHCYLMMRTKRYFVKDLTFMETQKFLSGNNCQNVINYVREMSQAAVLYARLERSAFNTAATIDEEEDRHIRRALKELLFLEVPSFYSFILYCYMQYRTEKISKQFFLDTLSILENYTVRMGVTGNRTSSRALTVLIPALCGTYTLEGLRQRLITKSRYPTDAEIRKKLPTANMYEKRGHKYGQFLLRRIETVHKERPDFSENTMDHILPQEANNSIWSRYLGKAYSEVYNTLLHSIGNLCLTGYNSEMGRKGFDEKKSWYAKSLCFWTQEVGKKPKWGQEEILERANAIAEQVVTIWPEMDPENDYRWKQYSPTVTSDELVGALVQE